MLKWWNAHRNQFPLMSQAVGEVLCVPASSSASERAFSIGGLICSQRRGHLSPKKIEEQANIKLNHFAVKSYLDKHGKPMKSTANPDDKDFGLEEEDSDIFNEEDANSDFDLEYEELDGNTESEDLPEIELY